MDADIVQTIAAGWHPSSRTVTLTFETDNGYRLLVVPGKWCDALEDILRRSRLGYLPWIENYFTPISDDTWKCKECGQSIVGTAENGGLVCQLQRHSLSKHARNF